MNRSSIFLQKSLLPVIFPTAVALLAMAMSGQKPIPSPIEFSAQNHHLAKDTLPDICTVLPAEEIAALIPFTNPLSNSFPDPYPMENYKACYYEFWKENDYPGIKVSLLKFDSKEDALGSYNWYTEGHISLYEVAPERIFGLADSAFFGMDLGDTAKCNECALVMIKGVYEIIVAYKGQYKESGRIRKKLVAVKIAELMFDRIPGLASSPIRKKGN